MSLLRKLLAEPTLGKSKISCLDVEDYQKIIYDFNATTEALSATEAKLTSPQIRKILEHSWNALEQSGYIKQCQDLTINLD